MADAQPPAQLDQVTFVEDLTDESHAGQVVQALTVGGADAGALLAAVLQGVEGEERQPRGLGVLRCNGDDAAGLTEFRVPRSEFRVLGGS